MIKKLEEKLKKKVWAIMDEGSNFQMRHKNIKAVEKYKEALALLPEPIEQWVDCRILWKSIQENYWLNAQFNEGKEGGYLEALEYWKKIMELPHSIGNAHYHFRIGQIRYELGQFEKAKDELMRAYLISEMDSFEGGDTKYFELIKPIIEGKEDKNPYSDNSDPYSID